MEDDEDSNTPKDQSLEANNGIMVNNHILARKEMEIVVSCSWDKLVKLDILRKKKNHF